MRFSVAPENIADVEILFIPIGDGSDMLQLLPGDNKYDSMGSFDAHELVDSIKEILTQDDVEHEAHFRNLLELAKKGQEFNCTISWTK